MAAQPTNPNSTPLFAYLHRRVIAEFKFSPLFTTLFFPEVATFNRQNILVDNLDTEEVTKSAFCLPLAGSQG
ncbi:hypothetical protein WR17_25990, partial [Escherichia coli]